MARSKVATKHAYDPTRPYTDAFGRQRVSNPYSLFESQMEYDEQPLLWETALTTNGTITHNQSDSTLDMNVTAEVGSRVIRQSKQYFYYHPGKSLALITTYCFGDFVPGIRSRVGYFDDNDGVFLERDYRKDELFFVLRNGGADTRIAQSKWNQDCLLEGRGRTGITLNSNKAQILLFDLQWLGVGRVRCGFDLGSPIPAHFFSHANRVTTTYMRSANLPIRYEIENITGEAAGSMKQICSSLVSEGGFEGEGLPFSADSGTALRVATTGLPVISIRPKTQFQGRANRIHMIPVFSHIYGTDTALWRLIVGGTLTNAAWNDVDTNSGMEVDIAATAVTGGTIIKTGFVAPAGSGTNRAGVDESLFGKFPLSVNLAGDDSTILTLYAIGVGASTPSAGGGFDWKELR